MTGIGWTGVAVAIIGAAIGHALHERRRDRRSRQVPGTVVEFVPGDSIGLSPRLQVAVYEFVADDGRRVRKPSSVARGTPRHAVGETVAVWYDPADPNQSDIVGESAGIALIFGALGLLFTAVGIALVWGGR
jgi:hypothetical protein